MAALDELKIDDREISPELRNLINSAFWIWYYNHKSQTVSIEVWLFKVKVTMEVLHPMFIRLFGEDSALNHG